MNVCPPDCSSAVKANFGSLSAPWLANGPERCAVTGPSDAFAPRGSICTFRSTVADCILDTFANVERSSELTSDDALARCAGSPSLLSPRRTKRA